MAEDRRASADGQGWSGPPPPGPPPVVDPRLTAPSAVPGPVAAPTAPQPQPRSPDSRADPAAGGPVPGGLLGFTDVLDGAFGLYRWSGRLIVTAALSVLVPLQLMVAFAQRNTVFSGGFGSIANDPEAAEAVLTEGGSVLTVLVGFLLVQGLVLPLLAGAYLTAAHRALDGRQATLGEAWTSVTRRGPALLGAWWLHTLGYVVVVAPVLFSLARGGSAAGLAVLTMPLAVFGSLALMPLFMMAAPAVIVEGAGPVAAIRRAGRLATRQYFRTLGLLVGTSFVIGLLSLLLSGAPEVLGLVTGGGFSWVLLAIGAVISELISGPLTAHVALLTLIDARRRVEGNDLVEWARRRRPAMEGTGET